MRYAVAIGLSVSVLSFAASGSAAQNEPAIQVLSARFETQDDSYSLKLNVRNAGCVDLDSFEIETKSRVISAIPYLCKAEVSLKPKFSATRSSRSSSGKCREHYMNSRMEFKLRAADIAQIQRCGEDRAVKVAGTEGDDGAEIYLPDTHPEEPSALNSGESFDSSPGQAGIR